MAVNVAESAARAAFATATTARAAAAAAAAARAATADARFAAFAAADAAAVADAAHDTTRTAANAARAAADDANAAANAARAGATVRKAIRADFERLREKARAERWTNETSVSPTVLGPLWPDGPPPDWPKDEAAPSLQSEQIPGVGAGKRLVLKVEVPEVGSPEHARAIEDVANELISALNEAHIARGAGRLEIDDIKHLISALVKEGA